MLNDKFIFYYHHSSVFHAIICISQKAIKKIIELGTRGDIPIISNLLYNDTKWNVNPCYSDRFVYNGNVYAEPKNLSLLGEAVENNRRFRKKREFSTRNEQS